MAPTTKADSKARVDTACAMGEVRRMFRASHAAKHPRPNWRVRKWAIAAIVAVAVLPYALTEAYRAYLRLDPAWRFAEEVSLQPGPGGTRPVVIRWTTPPRIALLNATAEDTAFVRTFIVALNEALEGSRLSARLVEDGESNLQLYFATRPMLDRLAENLDAVPFPPVEGFYMIWPTERLGIVTAVAVIDAGLIGVERQAAIVRELARSFGLRGGSPVFAESAVFADGDRRSTATALSPVDRKLLRLLYLNLRSADGWSELRAAYLRYWDAP